MRYHTHFRIACFFLHLCHHLLVLCLLPTAERATQYTSPRDTLAARRRDQAPLSTPSGTSASSLLANRLLWRATTTPKSNSENRNKNRNMHNIINKLCFSSRRFFAETNGVRAILGSTTTCPCPKMVPSPALLCTSFDSCTNPRLSCLSGNAFSLSRPKILNYPPLLSLWQRYIVSLFRSFHCLPSLFRRRRLSFASKPNNYPPFPGYFEKYLSSFTCLQPATTNRCKSRRRPIGRCRATSTRSGFPDNTLIRMLTTIHGLSEPSQVAWDGRHPGRGGIGRGVNLSTRAGKKRRGEKKTAIGKGNEQLHKGEARMSRGEGRPTTTREDNNRSTSYILGQCLLKAA